MQAKNNDKKYVVANFNQKVFMINHLDQNMSIDHFPNKKQTLTKF